MGNKKPSVFGAGEMREEKQKSEVSTQWSGQSEKLRVFKVLDEAGRLYYTISQA